MEIKQKSIQSLDELSSFNPGFQPDLFLLFVSPTYNQKEETLAALVERYPDAINIGCSTSGEIMGNEVSDGTFAMTAIKFKSTKIKLHSIHLDDTNSDSFKTGKQISESLMADDLRHIIVLSDGLNVNGHELVTGLHDDLSSEISITGGLAGDGADFNETFVIINDKIESKKVLGLGFYGEDLKIGFGSQGGWDSFGLERVVTKSKDNVLYELDGQPALELYKSFLGDKAKELPGSGLLFPLAMRTSENEKPVVRTILGINEEEQSLTFAGSIHENASVRLMKANVDRLIDGAEESAEITRGVLNTDCQLALLVSCVGRRLVLKQMVEEEVEVVNEVLGENAATTGFYSYGEIAPFDKFTACSLHNQTMTITTFAE